MRRQKITLPKVLVTIFSAILFCLCMWYLVQVVMLGYDPNFFMKHFMPCCCLICLGIDVIIINQTTKKRIVGENKGDEFMSIIGVLIILSGLLSIFVSFIL